MFAHLGFVIYESIRQSGTKMEPKAITEFMPRWYDEDGDEDEIDSNEALRAKAMKAFAGF